ncbi:acyl carrier protein [Myxococcota bacterium]|nr:acyl carrier protein [Myxococcota bacterium]
MHDRDTISHHVKQFVLTEFLAGEDPSALEPTTPLITAGILDSLATLKLVSFLEKHFGIHIHPHEADVDHLNTLDDITHLVAGKLSS